MFIIILQVGNTTNCTIGGTHTEKDYGYTNCFYPGSDDNLVVTFYEDLEITERNVEFLPGATIVSLFILSVCAIKDNRMEIYY